MSIQPNASLTKIGLAALRLHSSGHCAERGLLHLLEQKAKEDLIGLPKEPAHTLDIFAGLVYNKNNKEMPAGNRHLPVVETRRLPLHNTYNVKCKALRAVSRLIAADGSLLFIVQIQHERHNAGNGTQGPKDRQKGVAGKDAWHRYKNYRIPP